MSFQTRTRLRRPAARAALALCIFFASQNSHLSAHPLSQGRMELVIFRDKITLWASVAVEQVVVQQSLPTNDNGLIVTQADAYRAHGAYLLKHIFLKANGAPLEGHVASLQEPDNKTLVPGEPGKEYAVYELEYPAKSLPSSIELRQNILLEVEFTPGNPWQSTYITGIRQDGAPGQENLLLTSANALTSTCDWSIPTAPPKPASSQETKSASTPPAILKQPLPERPLDRSHFIAGVVIGVCAIYLLGRILRKFQR